MQSIQAIDKRREVLLGLRGISKRFGHVQANRDISLDVYDGEILGLLGENGAGKSTLMSILSGNYQPDAGEIWWKGQPVRIKSPRDASALGIGMVHQHFTLIPELTVAENIILGLKSSRFFFTDLGAAHSPGNCPSACASAWKSLRSCIAAAGCWYWMSRPPC